MEPANDPRLKRLLHEWQVPNAPDALEARVFGLGRPWWQALMRSRIRVPLPVAIAFSLALVWLAATVVRDRVTVGEPPGTTYDLRDFQPVKSVHVRIERSSDGTP
jgi:hypothetical protein